MWAHLDRSQWNSMVAEARRRGPESGSWMDSPHLGGCSIHSRRSRRANFRVSGEAVSSMRFDQTLGRGGSFLREVL